MLGARLEVLRARLDALRAGRGSKPPWWLRVQSRFAAGAHAPALPLLEALDRELDLVGVHTSADVRLLRLVQGTSGRAAALSAGLWTRAEVAVDEFAGALREAELSAYFGRLPPGRSSELEHAFGALARAVKVAIVFARPDADRASRILDARPRKPQPAPRDARLAIAEFLCERARLEVADLPGRRRDLAWAQALLLGDAEQKEDRPRLRQLRLDVATARERERAAPLAASLGVLVNHLRHVAVSDPRQAWRSTRALYERAVEASDEPLASIACAALDALVPDEASLRRGLERDEARRSLGCREDARGATAPRARTPSALGGDSVAEALAELALGLSEDARLALEFSAQAARCFDVDGPFEADGAWAEVGPRRPVLGRAPYPTPMLSFEHTGSLERLQDFVVDHPKLLLLRLASNQMLVRTYLEEQRPPPRPRRRTAARVYLLDASGSMLGARARLRDALLTAELNRVRLRARLGEPFDPLYFAFFADHPGELACVDSGAEATRQLELLFQRSPAGGGTELTAALRCAFESVASARGRDPYLATATIVLITDGEEPVDLEVVRECRATLRAVDLKLSVICLGEENADLKRLVEEQREVGGAAFYHHLDDLELAVVPTEFDSLRRTLLPMDVDVTPGALERLAPHLTALEQLAHRRTVVPAPTPDDQFDALFPEIAGVVGPARELAIRVGELLDAVAQAAALAPIGSRAAEAIGLLTHLLGLFGIGVPRYLEVVAEGSAALGATLRRLRLVCRRFGPTDSPSS
jgi:hypothetical protein